MKLRLFRPIGAGVPLALLAVSLVGKSQAALQFAACLCAISLLSLSAPEALRRAAARQTSPRRVLGSALTALSMVGFAACAAVFLTCDAFVQRVKIEHIFDFERMNLRLQLGAAVMVTATRVLEELLYAENDSVSAAVADALAALSVAAGQMLFDSPEPMLWLTSGAFGITAFVTAFAPHKFPELSLAPLREARSAQARTLLYPLTAFLLLRGRSTTPGFFAGWSLIELSRTPMRRDERESRPLRIWMGFACAAACALTFAAPAWSASDATAAALGALCALTLYAAPTPRSLAVLLALTFCTAGIACSMQCTLNLTFSRMPYEIRIPPEALSAAVAMLTVCASATGRFRRS